MRYQLEAPAKINPFLEILGPRPDGYHDVDFVMQALELSDTLTLEIAGNDRQIAFSCSEPTLETSDNLIVKAYHLFYDRQPKLEPYAISLILDKNIPIQAGLGGGSSDAAAMLRLLNHIHNNLLSLEQLVELGSQLGSDVPFFFFGGTCRAQGRGERITPLTPAYQNQGVFLIKPLDWGISTPQAYQYIKETPYIPQSFSETILFNRFESALFPHISVLIDTKEALTAQFGPQCLLSGSGPTFFVFINHPPSAVSWEQFTCQLPFQRWWSNFTKCQHALPQIISLT